MVWPGAAFGPEGATLVQWSRCRSSRFVQTGSCVTLIGRCVSEEVLELLAWRSLFRPPGSFAHSLELFGRQQRSLSRIIIRLHFRTVP